MIVMNSQNELNSVIRDYFDIAGICITTIIIIYDLFITKFIEIFTMKPEKRTSKMKAINL